MRVICNKLIFPKEMTYVIPCRIFLVASLAGIIHDDTNEGIKGCKLKYMSSTKMLASYLLSVEKYNK